MNGKTHLEPSLTLRPARWTDLTAVAKLVHDVAEIEGDSLFVLTAEELANEWKSEGFNYERAGMYVAGEFAMYEKELRTGEG